MAIGGADSAYDSRDIIAATHRAGARFSLTARATPVVTRDIASIGENAWTLIRYPDVIWDEDEERWISVPREREVLPAKVNEVPFAAFVSRLFTAFCYHAVFTDSPLPMLEAEADHRATRSSSRSSPT
ncbi:hypothetical protein [Kineococcus glutinatus]|uniref:DDE family transposase n=1 Tax=Kineococcus glutinatus TaxID=1070872 RepID=A0ABP9H9U1_9ACTN